MTKGRLEAFSDGVVAIILTIMVLELKVPHGDTLEALQPMRPVFLAYVLSFVNIGIYWNNHHHMLHATERVSGAVLWANLHLLFWLSLTPVTTAWMGENPAAPWPSAAYGVTLLASAIAYYVLQQTILGAQGPNSKLRRMLGNDLKGRLSPVGYVIGVALAFVKPGLAQAVYAGIAAMWLIPDRRIEKHLAD